MSRIGNRTLIIPEGVSTELNGSTLTVKSSKGTLTLEVSPLIEVTINDKEITTTQRKENPRSNVMVGTTNSLINNMLIGVSKGYTKGLEMVGVGYRFNVQGKKINISAGFSHPVVVDVPEDLSATQISNTEITIEGIDKQKVTEFAANIRDIRRPEPYKGKGIRYKGEVIRRKEGKKASK